MAKLRERIEKKFEQFAEIAIRYRWIVLATILCVAAVLGFQLKDAKFNTNTEGFFHETDPTMIEYNAFRDQFGRDEMIVVMIRSDRIFTLPFLERLKALHDELEEGTPLLNDIDSLINARSTRGEEGELLVEDLLEDLPETDSEIEELKRYVLSHPLYKNLLISEDGSFTAIMIETETYSQLETESDEPMPLTDEENSEIVLKVQEIIQKYQQEDFQVYMAGSPVVTEYLKKAMQNDMKRFTGLAIAAIATLLFLLFRRVVGILLPLATVIVSVVSTLGLMAFLNVAIKLPTMILPSFLLAIAVGASVHLVAMFFKQYDGTNKENAIVWAFAHSGLPIVMTSLTTAAGLASFSAAEIAPIADLGRFSAFGILLALFYTLTLIPVLLSIFPVRPILRKQAEKINWLDRILLASGRLANTHPWKVIGLSFAIFVAAMIGISFLKMSHNNLKWFPKDAAVRVNTERIDERLKGSVSMEVVLTTKEENGLYEPEILQNIEKITDRAKQYKDERGLPLVQKTVSLADTLKEIHKALNANREEYYAIPDKRALIAQEFLLFENSGTDDLENQVDSLFRKTRVMMKLPWMDAMTMVDFVNDIEEYANTVMGSEVDVVVTGLVVLFMETIYAMINSTLVSYSIAGVVITILMILLLGKLKIGLLSMIPNLLPIILTLGFMGWFDIKLDMFTLLIGSIAIGLAVDDTIHIFHNFRKYHEITGSTKKAIEESLLTAGRAISVTSLTLATGFWIFMAASLNNLFVFGCLTGITLMTAFVGDIVLAPALLTVVYPERTK